MGSKKKKAGSHRSRLQQQKLLENSGVNDSAILALAAPPLTVHATVPSNSNSKQRPPGTSPNVCSLPTPCTLSPPHSSPPNHDDSNINHIFVEDWIDDDALEDEEVDFASSMEDYVGAPPFSTPTVDGAPLAGGQSPPPTVAPSHSPLPPAVGSLFPSGCGAPPPSTVAGAQPSAPPLPTADSLPFPPLEKTVLPSSLSSGCRVSPTFTVAGNSLPSPGNSNWRDLFPSNRSAEELRYSVEISLPEGPALHQSVVYDALPKYCNFCHVLGHSRLLCPKAGAAAQAIPCHQPLGPTIPADKGNVLNRLGPQPPPPPLPQVQDQSHDDAIPGGSKEDVGSAVDLEPATGWVTVESRRKSRKQDKGKEVEASAPVLEAISPIRTGSAQTSPGTTPRVPTPGAEGVRAIPPPCTESLALSSCAGDEHHHSPSKTTTLATTAGATTMPGILAPVMEVPTQSRVQTRSQKQRGRRDRIPPSLASG
ncbi:hypothetical protein Peur_004555 [Populus x canadensis]